MQEPSPSSHSSTVPAHPFSFEIDSGELKDVCAMADRFAPTVHADYSMLLHITSGKHRWNMREDNVTAWIDFLTTSGDEEHFVVVPLHFLNTIGYMYPELFTYVIEFDPALSTLTFTSESDVMCVTVPHKELEPVNLQSISTSHIEFDSADLARFGNSLLVHPTNTEENEDNLPYPFLRLTVCHSSVHGTRNWAAFDGPVIEHTVKATSTFEGMIEMYAYPICREMAYLRHVPSTNVSLAFSASTPEVAMMTADNWGMRIDLGTEGVAFYRTRIEGQLLIDDMEVELDTRIGFNPIVQVQENERLVDIAIVGGATVVDTTLRASTMVLVDAPWNLDIASEINAWNNQWVNVKLIHQNQSLVAVCDFPVTSIDYVSTIVRDLVAKAATVDQVIGVLL